MIMPISVFFQKIYWMSPMTDKSLQTFTTLCLSSQCVELSSCYYQRVASGQTEQARLLQDQCLSEVPDKAFVHMKCSHQALKIICTSLVTLRSSLDVWVPHKWKNLLDRFSSCDPLLKHNKNIPFLIVIIFKLIY